MRRPLKTDALAKLKSLNVPVGCVIDVGVLSGTSELREGFKGCRQILVEPIVEWNDAITAAYSKAGSDFEIVNVAASDFDGTMNMETSTVIPGRAISHARLTEKVTGANLRTVPVRKVDTIVAERVLPKPFLLKVDVDGVDLEVLKGAAETLKHTSVVIVEAHPRDFVERSNYIVSKGFQLFDIVNICYYDGRLAQIDMVFLNDRIVVEKELEIYRGGFDFAKWEAFR